MTTFTIAGEGEPYDESQAAVARIALTAARRRQQRAVKLANGRDYQAAHQATTAAILAMYRAQPNVYALTAGSTVNLAAVMCQFGMLDLESGRRPQMPLPKDYGVTAAVLEEFNETGDEPLPLARLNAELDAWRDRQAVANPVGIPAYKMQSPEGWLITPDEITAALGAYRTALGDDDAPPMFWWAPWIDFLERASKHLGIRVR